MIFPLVQKSFFAILHLSGSHNFKLPILKLTSTIIPGFTGILVTKFMSIFVKIFFNKLHKRP